MVHLVDDADVDDAVDGGEGGEVHVCVRGEHVEGKTQEARELHHDAQLVYAQLCLSQLLLACL